MDWVHGVVDHAVQLGSMVDRRWRRQEVRWRFTGVRRVSARGHQWLPALAGQDEEDEAEPEAGSPENKRRRRGGATAAENSHYAGTRARERAQERGEEVRWWPRVLRGLNRGPGEHRGGVMAGGSWR
jgi:hypothetical protein